MTTLPKRDVSELRGRMDESLDMMAYTLGGSRLAYFIPKVRAFAAFEKSPQITADMVSENLRGTTVERAKSVTAHVHKAGKKFRDNYKLTYFLSAGKPADVAQTINSAMKTLPSIVPYIAVRMGPYECKDQNPDIMHRAAKAYNSGDTEAKKARSKKCQDQYALATLCRSEEYLGFWTVPPFAGATSRTFIEWLQESESHEDVGIEELVAVFQELYPLKYGKTLEDDEYLTAFQKKVWPVAAKCEFHELAVRWNTGAIISKYAPTTTSKVKSKPKGGKKKGDASGVATGVTAGVKSKSKGGKKKTGVVDDM